MWIWNKLSITCKAPRYGLFYMKSVTGLATGIVRCGVRLHPVYLILAKILYLISKLLMLKFLHLRYISYSVYLKPITQYGEYKVLLTLSRDWPLADPVYHVIPWDCTIMNFQFSKIQDNFQICPDWEIFMLKITNFSMKFCHFSGLMT